MRSPSLSALFLVLAGVASISPNPWGLPGPRAPANSGKVCIVYAHGNKQDDAPQIWNAFNDCDNGGTVVFPEGQNYWIATKFNPVVHDVTVEWKGTWTMSDDLNYWRNNSYPIAFQNHHAGFVMSGDRIHINGYGTGGIYGNGNAWYNAEHGNTQPGRPMPFVWWNVSDVFVEHFFIKDPPLWSINIMNGTNMWFDDMYVNATAVNAPWGANWVQNTDGFDTMDAHNIMLTNMVYQGGDDCIAIKPRSYNIFVQNITIHGGNGIAIGSLGQYFEDSSVVNVVVKDVNILTNNGDMHNAAYIKTWDGIPVYQDNYESEFQPRGGGWGVVQNLRFENFYVQGAAAGPSINQDSGGNSSTKGTSLMEVSNIAFVNFTGSIYSKSNTTASVSCSTVHPCFNIAFQNVSLSTNTTAAGPKPVGSCTYIQPNGVYGLQGKGC